MTTTTTTTTGIDRKNGFLTAHGRKFDGFTSYKNAKVEGRKPGKRKKGKKSKKRADEIGTRARG
jgi:hypothetical protein